MGRFIQYIKDSVWEKDENDVVAPMLDDEWITEEQQSKCRIQIERQIS